MQISSSYLQTPLSLFSLIDYTSEEDPQMSSSGDELERDYMPRKGSTLSSGDELKTEDVVAPVEEPPATEPETPPPKKMSYKPAGGIGVGMPGMGMPVMGGKPGGGGVDIFAEMKKKQEQRRASNKQVRIKKRRRKPDNTSK